VPKNECAKEYVMFKTIAAITVVLTSVALLSTTSQSVEPVQVVSHERVHNVSFDATGAMYRNDRG
jgi:hypothetical protein